MTRWVAAAAFLLSTFVLASAEKSLEVSLVAADAGDPHAYFKALVARSDHWKSYSLRDQQQLLDYKSSRSQPPSVTYDPTHDPDPRRQDAAKVVVPAFGDPTTTLAVSASAMDTTITLTETRSSYLGQYVNNRQLRVDREVMTITGRSASTLTVSRGVFGTTAVSHASGAAVALSTNSLPNQVLLPLGTEDGHSYLVTWDAWFAGETRMMESGLVNWKTFQFRAPNALGGNPGIWYQVDTRFDGLSRAATTASGFDASQDIALIAVRGYSVPIGTNVTSQDPLQPMTGQFVVRSETWVRYWVLIEQKKADPSWTLMSLWAADETHDPVQLYSKLQFDSHGGIQHFDLEYNTSSYALKSNRGPLISYVRNVVALRDVTSLSGLLQRPIAGLLPTPTTSSPALPLAPQNLRILSSR